jgi:hypothetical protein
METLYTKMCIYQPKTKKKQKQNVKIGQSVQKVMTPTGQYSHGSNSMRLRPYLAIFGCFLTIVCNFCFSALMTKVWLESYLS